MKQIILSSAFLMALGSALLAQKTQTPPASGSKKQNIVITKSGTEKGKTTIVIDGDKITVNGKPLNEYKGDIEITENENPDVYPAAPLPPLPPMYSHGGAKSFSSNFSFSSNRALLGVYADRGDAGARIKSVTKDSPAEKAGLKEGDVITKVGSDSIGDAEELTDAISKYEPEDKVSITYLRDKKESSLIITLAKNQQTSFEASGDYKRFMQNFRNLSRSVDDDKVHFGVRVEDTENGTGVKITDIDDDDAPAAKAGLKEEDIVTQINGKKVTSIKDAKNALTDSKPGDTVSVSYLRKGITQTKMVHFPKPLESSDL